MRISFPGHWRIVGLLTLCGALAGGCNALDTQQRRWIFQPAHETPWAGPRAVEDMQDQWIEFRSRVTGLDTRLHALWHPSEHAEAPVLLYLHGARWDVTGSASRIRRMQSLGFHVLAVDYRGFGRSGDELPSQATALEDARAAWDWIAQRHPQRPRYIFGHSLGGAIAVHLAADVPDAAGLIVENSFPSIREVVSTFRWGWLPLGPLISQRFEAARAMERVRAPVLVAHGSEDRLIPPELGQALYERASAPKRWLLVEGGTHHNTNSLGLEQYREAIGTLFGPLPGPAPTAAAADGA
ncbi:alpha/beta hydrolase [Caldimonas tepidiphila]|uniref:alpha/beta hydrolase n=1 Tax=Caldimonas tepidiphila TaxID=2315841 RepID=UPI000E5C2DAF|nr:alpha/beta fold hydrolase [Caldimonas tepidiphila]